MSHSHFHNDMILNWMERLNWTERRERETGAREKKRKSARYEARIKQTKDTNETSHK